MIFGIKCSSDTVKLTSFWRITMSYTPSQQFDTLVANVEIAVAKTDYQGLCDALVTHAKVIGYTGREFNRAYNTSDSCKSRWCKAESSDGRLQYILAGCGKSSKRGRVTVLAQWDYFCQNNLTSQTVMRRLKDNPAIIDGLARMYPKGDSTWGTKEGRANATEVSLSDLNQKQKKELTATLERADAAPTNLVRLTNHNMFTQNFAAAVAARQAKKQPPVTTKPEKVPAVKQAQKRSRGKAA